MKTPDMPDYVVLRGSATYTTEQIGPYDSEILLDNFVNYMDIFVLRFQLVSSVEHRAALRRYNVGYEETTHEGYMQMHAWCKLYLIY